MLDHAEDRRLLCWPWPKELSMTTSQSPRNRNETNWIVQVNDGVGGLPSKSEEEQNWEKRSIYRVPNCITSLNRKAYYPQAVSFGPYHHGERHLLPMEEHKHRALLHFLRRSGKQVDPFLESLRAVVQDLKDSYQTLDRKWMENDSSGTVGRFLQLMITDGCFMLEILRSRAEPQDDYPPNDPIFGKVGLFYILPYIQRDMLMLENQLPMLVLKQLVHVESNDQKGPEYINGLILRLYSHNEYVTEMSNCLHVLDVLWNNLLLPENMLDQVWLDLHDVRREKGEYIIRSATELVEAGIRLKKSKTRSLMDISFSDGVLSLPSIIVDDITESMFLNLMTFERFHFRAGNKVTAYIFFMDNIIDTEQDVTLLRTHSIIENFLGSNKEVARLFNSLTRDMALYLKDREESVQTKINEHCKRPWNMWRANLMHTYFRNPWSILSLIAAILLFALTIIQTVYTTFGYYK